jgi:hypothetical protein
MSEAKKNPAMKEKGEDKSNRESRYGESCDKEDMTEDECAQKGEMRSDARKNPAQSQTGHKHGGNCSH